jgi:nucleotide-binding universal stress UspA family protein
MKFSKVLVGTDFSAESLRAIELAAKDTENQEIILFHVHRLFEPVYIAELGMFDPLMVGDLSKSYRESAQKKLNALAEKYFKGSNIRCEAMISLGTVAEEICSFANKEKCDLIVMGSRGHSTLGALFLGSVVQKVLLISKCPVVVVPLQEINK